jgi:hypothetical protein
MNASGRGLFTVVSLLNRNHSCEPENPLIRECLNDQEVVVVYARVAGPGWLVFVELPIGEWTKN